MKQILYFLLVAFLCSCQKIDTTWNPAEPKTAFRLNEVFFLNEKIGYAAGGDRFAYGICLKTIDGGESWDTLGKNLSDKGFYALKFKDEGHGIIGNTDGHLYMTTDSGNTWTDMQSFIWRGFYAFDYVNDTTIIGVGGNGYNAGIIWRYTQNTWWTFIDTPQFQLRDVDFVNDSVGYACGYSTVLKSTDGGLSWQLTSAKNELFSALCFLDEKTGYAVGRTGTIIKTTDGGKNWQVLRSGNNPLNPPLGLNDVAFVSTDVGYIVGDNGLVMKTIDGGNTWKRLEKYAKIDFQAIHLFAENKGIIVGTEGTIVNFLQ